jgi:hypothetical protein
MKLTMDDLTPEQEAMIPEYVEKSLEGVFDGGKHRNFNDDNARAAVEFIYDHCFKTKPVVLYAGNPYDAQKIYQKLVRENGYTISDNDYMPMFLFGLNVYSDAYFAFHDFIKDNFGVTPEGHTDILDKFQRAHKDAGIFAAIWTEDVVIVSKYPKFMHRDEQNCLHNTEGVAIEWDATIPENGWKSYFIHGRKIPSDFFEKVLSGNYTKEEWINEENEELRAAAYEIIGEEKFAEFLDTEMIDTKQREHLDGTTETLELWKTKEKYDLIGDVDINGEVTPQPFAWVKFICPSTGANYWIAVEPHFNDALEAAASTSPFYGGEIESGDDYVFTQRA